MHPPASKAQSSRSAADESRLEHRRRQAAGLLLIAICVLVFSLWRAGWAAVFPTGWWRFW